MSRIARSLIPRRSSHEQVCHPRFHLNGAQHPRSSWHSHFFDSIVNDYLIRHCALDPSRSSVIGLVVSQRITFSKPIGYPDPLLVGLSVVKLGRSSVTYRVGLFRARQSPRARETGMTWDLDRLDEVRRATGSLEHRADAVAHRKRPLRQTWCTSLSPRASASRWPCPRRCAKGWRSCSSPSQRNCD